MAKRLVIDMYKCDECTECTVKCGYMYQPDVTDHGLRDLREQISFMLICRRCEEPSCVAACRFSAIERQESSIIKRYNMRCVSCKCCSQACPFGTIYPELVPFYAVKCDYCMRSMTSGDLSCISNCAKKAVEYREVDEVNEKGVFLINEHLAAKSPKWDKKDV